MPRKKRKGPAAAVWVGGGDKPWEAHLDGEPLTYLHLGKPRAYRYAHPHTALQAALERTQLTLDFSKEPQ